MSKHSLDDLTRFITILIVDDQVIFRESTKESLNRYGFDTVWIAGTWEEAMDHLPATNILLTDFEFPNLSYTGIDLINHIKKNYNNSIETILFSAHEQAEHEVKKLKTEVTLLKKPFPISLLNLWIKELAKRIWLKQILDNDPDEVMVYKPDGTILFVSKSKEKIFGENLLGKKCFETFQFNTTNKFCEGCPGLKAFQENRTVRTEWDYQTKVDAKQHKVPIIDQAVDIVTAPLHDKTGEKRAIIEISRDITLQKTADRYIEKMEQEKDWVKRTSIFLDGFVKMGYPRVRLYLHQKTQGKDELRLVSYKGRLGPGFKKNKTYLIESNTPTRVSI